MATNPTLLTQPIAANGAKNVIPNTTVRAGAMSQDQGFPAETSLPLGAGGVAPSREDFNGAFNLLSGLMFYAQKGWQFEFDETQDYFAGCIVRDTLDGNLYEAINDVSASSTHPSNDSTNWKSTKSNDGVPMGTLLPFAGSTTPAGYLVCDGSAVSRTTYAGLFDVIGVSYGSGDGSTTFNLPDIPNGSILNMLNSNSIAFDSILPVIVGTTFDAAGSYINEAHKGWHVYGSSPDGCYSKEISYNATSMTDGSTDGFINGYQQPFYVNLNGTVVNIIDYITASQVSCNCIIKAY